MRAGLECAIAVCLRRRRDDLPVRHDEPGVGLPCPVEPARGHIFQFPSRRVAAINHMFSERRLDNAVGPEPTPPRSVVRRGKAPRARRCFDIGEPRLLCPFEEVPTGVGLPAVGDGDRPIDVEPSNEAVVEWMPSHGSVVGIPGSHNSARATNTAHLA